MNIRQYEYKFPSNQIALPRFVGPICIRLRPGGIWRAWQEPANTPARSTGRAIPAATLFAERTFGKRAPWLIPVSWSNESNPRMARRAVPTFCR